MNEVEMNACACNPCVGPSCTCGCQSTVAPQACACGPACACGTACTCANRSARVLQVMGGETSGG